jgi:hypothetical protein
MVFAVFIRTNGEWKMHGAPFLNKSDAVRECAYLVGQLGLTAEVFKK